MENIDSIVAEMAEALTERKEYSNVVPVEDETPEETEEEAEEMLEEAKILEKEEKKKI